MVDVMYKVPDASDDDNDEHQHIPEPQSQHDFIQKSVE